MMLEVYLNTNTTFFLNFLPVGFWVVAGRNRVWFAQPAASWPLRLCVFLKRAFSTRARADEAGAPPPYPRQ